MSGQSKKVSRFVSNMVAILEDERRATIKTVNEEVQKQNGPENNTTHENALNTTTTTTTTQNQTNYVAPDASKVEKEKEEQTRSTSEAAKVESIDTKKSEENNHNNNNNNNNYNFNRRHSRSGSIGSNPRSRSGSVSSLVIRDDDQQQFEEIDTQRIESGELYESLKDILLSVKSKRSSLRQNATPTTRPHNYSRSPSLSSIDDPIPKSTVSNLPTLSQTQTQTQNHTLSQNTMPPTHPTNNAQFQNTTTQNNSNGDSLNILNSSTNSNKPLPLTSNEKVNKPIPSEVESLLLNMLAQREKLVNMIVSYSGENMETHRMLLGEVKNLDKAIQKLRGLDNNNTNAEGLKVDLSSDGREYTQTPTNSDPHIKLRSQSLTNGRRVSKATRDEVILRIKQRMDMEAKIEKDANLNPKRHTLSHSLPERKLNRDNGANTLQNETLANLQQQQQQQNTLVNRGDYITSSAPNSKLEMERRKAKLLELQSQLSHHSPSSPTTTSPTNLTSPINKSPSPSHSFMNDDEDEFPEPDYFNQQRYDPRMMLTSNTNTNTNTPTPTPTQTLTRKNSFPQYSHTFSSASPIQVQQPFSPFSTAYLERMSQTKQTTKVIIATSTTPSPTPSKSTSPIQSQSHSHSHSQSISQSHSPYQTLPHQPSITNHNPNLSTSNRYNTISNHQSSPYLKIDGDNKFVPYSFNYYW